MSNDICWVRGAVHEYAVQAVVMEEAGPRVVVAFQEDPDGWAIYRRHRQSATGMALWVESHGLFHDPTQAMLNVSELALEEYHEQEANATEEHPHDEQFRQAAAEMYEDEGTLEIDANAIVSRGDDPGAYVQAWVWVAYSDIPDLEFDDAVDDAA